MLFRPFPVVIVYDPTQFFCTLVGIVLSIIQPICIFFKDILHPTAALLVDFAQQQVARLRYCWKVVAADLIRSVGETDPTTILMVSHRS